MTKKSPMLLDIVETFDETMNVVYHNAFKTRQHKIREEKGRK
jgi:hypothetical protein